MNTSESLVQAVAFKAQPCEYKVVALRECPTPQDLALCDTPDKAAAYWRTHVESHPYFNPECECFAVFILNTRRRVKGHYLVSIGIQEGHDSCSPARSVPPGSGHVGQRHRAAAHKLCYVEQLEVVADKGYYNQAQVSACAEEKITAYIAKPETSANAALGLYTKNDFAYDAQRDVYRCPAGGELTHRFNTYEQGRALRYYRTGGCATCPLKEKCTRNQGGRTITREEDEALMEAMAQRVKAQPEKLGRRKGLVEHPFGTIKRWFGYTYFLVKGLEQVRGEWTLMTLAYNWKRVLNLVSVAELLVAVRRLA